MEGLISYFNETFRNEPKIIQNTLVQFFINKPEKVKISKSKVVVKTEQPLTDYSKFTIEELDVKYAQADRIERTRILFELRQRGINIRDFQRKKEGLR